MRDHDATNIESRVDILSTRLNGLLFFSFTYNCKHNSRAEFESVGEDLTLVDVGQFIRAIIELFKYLFLLIVQSREKTIVMIGYVSHQLFGFFVMASAISVGADIAVE